MNEATIKVLVERFLAWPVPASCYPDGTPGKPGRTGTNLLTYSEAKEMLEYVLATPAASVPAGGEVPKGFALVPLRLTQEMDDVIAEEGWQWEDLLAAAGTITTEQYDDIAAQPILAQDAKDARRLDWLETQGVSYGFEDMHEGNAWAVSGPFSNLREAIDAAILSSEQSQAGGGGS